MKKSLIFLLLVLAVYWGSQHKTEVQSYWDKAKAAVASVSAPVPKNSVSTDDSGSSVSGNEAEEPKMVSSGNNSSLPTVADTPPGPINLPENVYYTTERVTIVTASGVQAIGEAVRVTKIGEDTGKYLVDDGRTQMPIGPWKLTRDPQKVAELIKKNTRSVGPAPATVSVSTPTGTTPTVSPPKVQDKPPQTSDAKQVEIAQLRRQMSDFDTQISVAQESLRREIAMDNGNMAKGRKSSHSDAITRLQNDINSMTYQKSVANDRLLWLVK